MSNQIVLHSGIGQFYEMLNLISNSRNSINEETKKVFFNLEELLFIKPQHIVILACVIEELYQKGITSEIINESKRVNDYLEKIRFYEYWNQGFNRNAYTEVKNSSTLCLWKISRNMIGQYAEFAKRYFENSFFNGKELDILHINLSEIFNNIFDHSNSAVDGYVITQFYPRSNKLEISICDFGVGIPTNINKYRLGVGKQELIDCVAIEEALKDGTTTQSTKRNMGKGLDTVKRIVNETNGTLKIISNRGYLLSLSNKEASKLSPLNETFPGTLVIIEIDTRFLDDIEEISGEVFAF